MRCRAGRPRNMTLHTAHANTPQFPRGWLFMHMHEDVGPEKPPTQPTVLSQPHTTKLSIYPSIRGADFCPWSMIKPDTLILSCTYYVYFFFFGRRCMCNRYFALCSMAWISYSLFNNERRIYFRLLIMRSRLRKMHVTRKAKPCTLFSLSLCLP